MFYGLLTFFIIVSLAFRIRQKRGEAEKLKVEKELLSYQKRFQAVVDHAMDALITISVNGQVTMFNPVAEKIFGYRRGEIIGKNIKMLMPESMRSEHDGYLRKYLAGGNPKVIGLLREETGLRKDGSTFPLELSIGEMFHNGQRQFIGLVRDITERKLTEDALSGLHRQNELILATAGDGIFGLDLKGRVTFINPSGEQMLGYEDGELVSRSVERLLYSPEYLAQSIPREMPFQELLENAISLRTQDSLFWRKDGSHFPVQYIASSVMDQDRIIGAVVSFQNISDRKKAEEKLKRYAGNLEQTNQELQDFTYTASHDLKEPLRKIISFGDRLLTESNGHLSERGRLYIDRMQSSALRMGALIDDLLKYSRLTMKEPGVEWVELGEVVSDVLSDIEILIEENQGTIELDELPTIQADPVQMRQLFQNLIVNSLKFARPDTPPVVGIKCMAKGKGWWEIHVRDNGIGFEEKYVDRIFKPFERLHSKSEFRGSGIGLAICQKIVAQHQGKINAFSGINEGALFIVTLPENHVETSFPEPTPENQEVDV